MVVSSLFMQVTLSFPIVHFVQSFLSKSFVGTEVLAVSWPLACLTSPAASMSSSRNAE